MTRSLRAGVIAIAAIAIGIGLSGCGSDTKAEPTTSQADVHRIVGHSQQSRTDDVGAGLGSEQDDRRLHQGEQHHRNPGAPGRSRLADDQLAVPARVGGRRKPHAGVGLRRDPVQRSGDGPGSADDHRAGVQADGQRRPGQDPGIRAGRDQEPARIRGRRTKAARAPSAGSTRPRSAAPTPRTASSAPSPRRPW